MSTTVDLSAPGRRIAVAAVLTAAVLGVLDALWLGVVSGDLYASQIGDLLAEEQHVGAAVAFYLVYVVGLVWFVLRPALARLDAGTGGIRRALVDAALFGLVTYATFDLTSMAVLDGFPLLVAAVDLTWGVALCTVTTAVVLVAMKSLGPDDATR
ncbi:DUF2177 family protein [Phycicoccus flavus]|uniref:DUF2177 family protein n=1 Tax=Phycicoccus flavus TaxID=2502783 RepID=UPI00197C7EEB|nr:DUF2177 family protein [Phycicoccus flavus]